MAFFDFKALDPIKKKAAGLCRKDRPGFLYFTLHESEHIDSLLSILELLFETLNRHSDIATTICERDRLLLTASVYLHDVGMYLPPTNDEEKKAESEGKDIGEYIRDIHHLRVKSYLEENIDLLKGCQLNRDEILDIVNICKGHRKENLTQYTGRTQRLAALLRLTDELDISKKRTPDGFLESNIREMDMTQKWHWIKHHLVDDWEINNNVHYGFDRNHHVLTFEPTFYLPDSFPVDIFLSTILKPIRKVIKDDGVGDILKKECGFEVVVKDNFLRQLIENEVKGIKIIDILTYYLKPPCPMAEFEEFCKNIYGEDPANLKDTLRISVHKDYAICIEKSYADKLENKYEELADHYEKAHKFKDAAKYYLLSASKANHYIPTDSVSDKIFMSEAAINYTKKAFHIMNENINKWKAGEQYAVLIEYGRLKRFTGEWTEAKRHIEKCMQLSLEVEKPQMQSEAYAELGSLLFEMGETDKGFTLVNNALEIQKTLGVEVGLVKILRALGNMHREQGNWKTAEEKSKLAVDIMRLLINSQEDRSKIDIQSKEGKKVIVNDLILCDCLRELGGLYANTNKYREKIEVYKEIETYLKNDLYQEYFIYIKGLMAYHNGKIQLQQNNIHFSIELLEKSKKILERFRNPEYVNDFETLPVRI